MSRSALAAPILAAGLLASSARAEEPSLVILLRPPRADAVVLEATTRLEAELRAAGFTVRVVEGVTGADGRAQVEGTAGGAGPSAFATIALLGTDRGAAADVWVADHITHKTLVRRLDVSDPGVENAASDLAVRSVELLRASLLEVTAPQRRELPAGLARWLRDPLPARPPVAPPPRPRPPRPAPAPMPVPLGPAPAPVLPDVPGARATPSTPSRPRASLTAGVCVLVGPSFGPAPAPLLQVTVALPLHLALRGTLAPDSTTTLTAAAGTVALRQQLLRIDLAFFFGREDAQVFPLVALGGGVYHLRVDGTAASPYVGEHRDLGAGFVSASAGLGVHLHERVALVTDAGVLVFQPAPVVTIAGAVAGSTGRPAFLGGAGLQVDF